MPVEEDGRPHFRPRGRQACAFSPTYSDWGYKRDLCKVTLNGNSIASETDFSNIILEKAYSHEVIVGPRAPGLAGSRCSNIGASVR